MISSGNLSRKLPKLNRRYSFSRKYNRKSRDKQRNAYIDNSSKFEMYLGLTSFDLEYILTSLNYFTVERNFSKDQNIFSSYHVAFTWCKGLCRLVIVFYSWSGTGMLFLPNTKQPNRCPEELTRRVKIHSLLALFNV